MARLKIDSKKEPGEKHFNEGVGTRDQKEILGGVSMKNSLNKSRRDMF